MLIIGHRGSPGFPRRAENTKGSFRRALAEGADGIELDIRRCADGRIIVIHDDTLDRTTTGAGLVSRLSYSEISKLDAGDGESVPLLDDVLQEFGPRCWINVEVKETNLALDVANSVMMRNPSNVVVSGFKPFWEELSGVSRNVPIALLASQADVRQFGEEPLVQLAHEHGACAIHIAKESATSGLVQMSHAAGLAVRVFTVNEPADVARLARLGVDAIFSDYPGRSKQVLRDAGL